MKFDFFIIDVSLVMTMNSRAFHPLFACFRQSLSFKGAQSSFLLHPYGSQSMGLKLLSSDFKCTRNILTKQFSSISGKNNFSRSHCLVARIQNGSEAPHKEIVILPNISLTQTLRRTASSQASEEEKALLMTQMKMRLLNENSFLSWCRNGYLSSVMGIAMIGEGTTALSQSAGAVALMIGAMNIFWGTGCHLINLKRLRHVSGMSGFNLFLNFSGATLHLFLYLFLVLCFIGYLDEQNPQDSTIAQQNGVAPRLLLPVSEVKEEEPKDA